MNGTSFPYEVPLLEIKQINTVVNFEIHSHLSGKKCIFGAEDI